jgi:cytochrome c oxidase subunit 2
MLAVGLGLAPGTASAQGPSILDPASPNAASLTDLYRVIFYLAVAVFLLVEFLIIYAALRFRRRDGDAEPAQVHGNTQIELAWTITPAIIVVVLTIFSYRALAESYARPTDAVHFNVTGHQWWWEFEHTDPDFATATELVVPVGRPVVLAVESADVIHSFWVPQLAGKIDAVPGERDAGYGQNSLWFTAEREGRFEGQCAEFCGTQHAGMRLSIIAVPPEEYEAWVDHMATPAAEPEADSAAARGLELTRTRGCQGCHAIDGVAEMVGQTGPDLTHVASRSHLAGGVVANTTDNLTAWIRDPQALKPGAAMPTWGDSMSADELNDIVAYLETLE